MIASVHFELEDARHVREALLSTEGWTMREEAARILAMLDNAIAKGEADKARLDAEVGRFVEMVAPFLDQARERGTYVGEEHRAYSDAVQLPNERDSGGHWWAQIDGRMNPVQMVVHSKPHGGWDVVGYRWQPEGDERATIELADLRRENDRCVHCGHLRVECEKVPNTHCIYHRVPGLMLGPHEF